MVLSVLIPLYNEEEFIATLLDRVMAAPLPDGMTREIIVADDGSDDGSVERVEEVAARHPDFIRLLRSDRNQGKGSALRRAIAAASGDFSIIQDADLEYDPREYKKMLGPLLDGRADAVFGSRFANSEERRVLYFWHALANRILTTVCNVASDLNLTDMETCYKAFRTPLLKSIPLRSNRFGFEPEITIKLAKREARIYETAISYSGRTYAEGKKIGLKDAFEALWVILRYALSGDIYVDEDKSTLDAFSDAPNFNRWMADTISPSVGEKVLEIGAGIGNLSAILVRGKKLYVATDLDREHLERLRSRLSHRANLVAAELDAARAVQFKPFAGTVDTVVCLNVLEHVEDDLAALTNMHGVLDDRGRVIILVPEGQSVYGTLDEALGHCRRYSEAQLVKRMQQAGFAIDKVIRFNRVSRPGWWLNGKILKRRVVGRFQLKTFDRMVWLWRKIDSFLPWAPTSLIAIGRKQAPTLGNEREAENAQTSLMAVGRKQGR
jgi:glycosyltransferase involved in cell wall biosynthesis/phospholipid N-methyltransferase